MHKRLLHARLGRRERRSFQGETTVKRMFMTRRAGKHCAAALASMLALGGCVPLEHCAVPPARATEGRPEEPPAAPLTDADLSAPPPAAEPAAPPAEGGVAVPSTVRLDPEGASAPGGGPARLAGSDTPEAKADDFPGLSPAELEHYLVGRHVGYQEPGQ